MKSSRLIQSLAQLVLAALTVGPRLANAQTNQATETLPDVSFTIQFKDGRTQFHQGELITVQMLFASKVPKTYSLYGGTYDRSGRFEADSFHVDPQNGVTDPTAEYSHSGIFGFGLGGLSPGPITLAEKPYVVERDLNEMVRFDQPGHYRLSVTNQRVGKQNPKIPGRTVESFSLTSNTIEFEILPADPNWQKQKLREAAGIISSAGRDSRAACRTLRFMNSAAAEAEMIRLYPNDCQGEFRLGLVGSPRRRALIEAMETQITAPDYPVTSDFMQTLASLAFMNENPEPLPPYPTNELEKRELWQTLARKRSAAFEEIFARYSRQLATAVSRKTRPARAVTLDTLIQFDASSRGNKLTDNASAVDQLVSSVPDLFLDLSTERQYTLLNWYWHRIGSPAMLPVLRQLVAKRPTSIAEASLRSSFEDLRSVALKRLYELSPEEGRNLILREIKTRYPSFNASVLEMLPDAELAEVDEAVAAALDKSDAAHQYEAIEPYSNLIRRYGSASSLTRVKSTIAGKIGLMACTPQSSFLAYFLRTDPDYGAAALEEALAARGKGQTGCYRMTLEDVGRKFFSPGLEEIAIQHIDDPEREVAIQAIRLLGQKGSAKAEKPLLDRLERWHAEWQTRQSEVQPQIENGIVTGEPAQFELELAHALVNAAGWTPDADKLKRIDDLCFTPQAHAAVHLATMTLDDHTIKVTMLPSDTFPDRISIGTYRPGSIEALKQKLSGMPKGSHFVWQMLTPGTENELRLFQEIKSFLAERGITLDRIEK